MKHDGSTASGLLSIGELAQRSGAATSALRFYEEKGLITSIRSAGGQRRYRRDVLRRVAFIRTAQNVGLSLEDIAATLSSLPDGRTPTPRDWNALSRQWKPLIQARIDQLQRLQNQLDSCIGCGCLSLSKCKLYNPDDAASTRGAGPRYWLGDTSASVLAEQASQPDK